MGELYRTKPTKKTHKKAIGNIENLSREWKRRDVVIDFWKLTY